MKKVLIIDDYIPMRSYIEKFIPDASIDQVYKIPDDLSILASYDALIVDGLGINNKTFGNGLEFLMAYDKPKDQAVVYHSACGVYGAKAQKLYDRGISAVEKGEAKYGEKIALAIKGSLQKLGEANVSDSTIATIINARRKKGE